MAAKKVEMAARTGRRAHAAAKKGPRWLPWYPDPKARVADVLRNYRALLAAGFDRADVRFYVESAVLDLQHGWALAGFPKFRRFLDWLDEQGAKAQRARTAAGLARVRREMERVIERHHSMAVYRPPPKDALRLVAALAALMTFLEFVMNGDGEADDHELVQQLRNLLMPRAFGVEDSREAVVNYVAETIRLMYEARPGAVVEGRWWVGKNGRRYEKVKRAPDRPQRGYGEISADDAEEYVRELTEDLGSLNQNFTQLEVARVTRLLRQADPQLPKAYGASYVAAALSLDVGAFGCELEPGETRAEGTRRLSNHFRNAALKKRAAKKRPHN